MVHNLGHYDPVSFQPDPPPDSALDRRGECGRGQTQSRSQSDPDTLNLERRSVSSNSSRVGRAGTRPVCDLPEPQASCVCQPLSGSQSSSPGCVEYRLEYSPVGVCFPSYAFFAQGAPEDESFYLSDGPDRASLAGSVLVSGSPLPVSSSAPGVTDLSGASLPDSTRTQYNYHAWTLSGVLSHREAFQRRLPSVSLSLNGALPDWCTKGSGQNSVLGVIEGRRIQSQPQSHW